MNRRGARAFSDYRSCIDWLFARHRFVMKPGLERVDELLSKVGSPHRDFRIVHVGGTNGKGSTCCMMASMLSAHGLRTGLYTSPHVADFTERISISGRRIPRERVVDIVNRLKPVADEMEASFFEIATAASAVYFSEESVDLAVAEVGLGGRLDATNAFDSMESVITRIAVDHAHVLGAETTTIAAEKAGIIREAGLVVTGAEGPPLDVIRGIAAARKARFVSALHDSRLDGVQVGSNGSVFDFEYGGTSYGGLSVSMLGAHQVSNARVALCALHELARAGTLTLSEDRLRDGLSEARSVGRLQVLDRRPTLVADVAHNPDAASALFGALGEVFTCDRVIVVLGIMADKDARGFLAEMRGRADLVVATRASTPRAADPEDLKSVADELGIACRVVETPGAAIAEALSEASERDLVLITGSHYTVGDALEALGVGLAAE